VVAMGLLVVLVLNVLRLSDHVSGASEPSNG
jgi:hypothetical protein